MTSFSEAAWQRIAPLRQAIHQHPFNVELAAGTLTKNRFQSYVIQDSLYLVQYRRALLIAAAKIPEAEASRVFAESATGVLAVEEALHARYLKGFGVAPEDAAAAGASPDCFAYTSFLLAVAHQEPWEVLIAALLPCFWIYWDVGLAISGKAAPANPFQTWIDTYADEGFGEAVARVIAIADTAAAVSSSERHEGMLAAFERSSQYEWLFWDSAYRGRDWPSFVPVWPRDSDLRRPGPIEHV
ncbi:MAG: thiaminase II [Acetobacteraceae bacterium]